MKGWYKAAADRVPPPDRLSIKQITVEGVVLYHYLPPLGDNTPIYVKPLPMDYSLPMEDEIEWAVRRLKDNFSVGTSGMSADHIQQWLREAWKNSIEAETEAGEMT